MFFYIFTHLIQVAVCSHEVNCGHATQRNQLFFFKFHKMFALFCCLSNRNGIIEIHANYWYKFCFFLWIQSLNLEWNCRNISISSVHQCLSRFLHFFLSSRIFTILFRFIRFDMLRINSLCKNRKKKDR